MYGSEAWTITKFEQEKLDGCYTRMLRAALKVNWYDRITNETLYGSLPKISKTIKERRLRFAGHCWRRKDEIISKLLFWDPKHGSRNRGRPVKTYINQIEEDTGINRCDLPALMDDRILWRGLLHDIRASST